LISGTPTGVGTSSVTISATNGGGTGSATLALTINATPPKPSITSALTVSGTVGAAFSYTITASNTPTSYNATGLPAGLAVNTSSGAITGTPTAVGTSNVTISAANAGGTGLATLVLKIVAAPVITSTASATPNPATVGQSVTFSVTASDSDGDPLTYAWTFGDGANGSGTSATHTYAAVGTYTAKVVVSDPGGSSVTGSISVAVHPSGGGGGGGGSGGGSSALTMTVSKLQGSVNFKTAGHDAVAIGGVLPGVSAPFIPAGKSLTVNVSGATAAFTLDTHGKSRSGTSSIAFKLRPIKGHAGSFNGGDLAFVAKLQGGSWAGDWKIANVNATNVSLPLSVSVVINGNTYAATVTVTYSAKANVGGKFKK